MVVREVPGAAYRLAEAFWPGPLTVILPRSKTVADSVCAGLDTASAVSDTHLKLNKDTFFDHLATLKQIAYSNNSDNLVQALIELVPTFHHAENNYD